MGVREQPRSYQSIHNACLAMNEHSYGMEFKEKKSINIGAKLILNKVDIFDCWGDINELGLSPPKNIVNVSFSTDSFLCFDIIFFFFGLVWWIPVWMYLPSPWPCTPPLLFWSTIQPPAPAPELLTRVPWVSSSVQCSPVCSPFCSSGYVVSVRHVPEPL